MNPADLISQAQMRLSAKIPFVLYTEPGSTTIKAIFSSGAPARNKFVFAPFIGEALTIPFDSDDVFHSDLPLQSQNVPSSADSTGKSEFMALVDKALKEILAGNVQKIVVSRCEDFPLAQDDLFPAFSRMAHHYQSAFCYFWYHPVSGLWMGATPERLLRAIGPDFYTMALAGTMDYNESEHYIWGGKEKAEQRYVTDYILDRLRPMASEIGQHGPLTARAGNIVHLKTEISGVLKPGFEADDLVRALHPTPAVCGMPLDRARSFVLKNEGYDREYYSGYLGICSPEKTDLYVNLRCFKWEGQNARLYVGCGINQGSIPADEYIETVKKSNTVKSIL